MTTPDLSSNNTLVWLIIIKLIKLFNQETTKSVGISFLYLEYLGKQKISKPFKYNAQVICIHDRDFSCTFIGVTVMGKCLLLLKYHTDKYGVVVLQQILNIINPSNTNDIYRKDTTLPELSQKQPRMVG